MISSKLFSNLLIIHQVQTKETMGLTVSGYLIIISIGFFNSISLISPQFQFWLRRCIKHSRPCLTISKDLEVCKKNTLLCIIFSTLFSVFGNMAKHGLLCLIYYFKNCINLPPWFGGKNRQNSHWQQLALISLHPPQMFHKVQEALSVELENPLILRTKVLWVWILEEQHLIDSFSLQVHKYCEYASARMSHLSFHYWFSSLNFQTRDPGADPGILVLPLLFWL